MKAMSLNVLSEDGLAEVSLKLTKKELSTKRDNATIDWMLSGLLLEQKQ